MQSLVFLEPDNIKAIPFTTSDVIAENSKVSHHAIQQMISKYQKDLEEFGRVAFEMRALQTKGGTQETKIYHLNEQQAYFLFTLLRNTKPVLSFKKNLVKAFFTMKRELTARHEYREQLKPTRRTLTDEIQDNPNHGQWDYKSFTNLAYKIALGKIAVQIRKERNAPQHAKAIDYMTSDEIALIEKLTYKIAVLYEMGLDYHQIKAMLLNRQMIGKIA
jgi:phage regulator Rha-like protein